MKCGEQGASESGNSKQIRNFLKIFPHRIFPNVFLTNQAGTGPGLFREWGIWEKQKKEWEKRKKGGSGAARTRIRGVKFYRVRRFPVQSANGRLL